MRLDLELDGAGLVQRRGVHVTIPITTPEGPHLEDET
jgi:hypothetical protein